MPRRVRREGWRSAPCRWTGQRRTRSASKQLQLLPALSLQLCIDTRKETPGVTKRDRLTALAPEQRWWTYALSGSHWWRPWRSAGPEGATTPESASEIRIRPQTFRQSKQLLVCIPSGKCTHRKMYSGLMSPPSGGWTSRPIYNLSLRERTL